MRYPSLEAFSADTQNILKKGPIALILVEDTVEIVSTIRHHLERGFKKTIVFAQPEIEIPDDLLEFVDRVDFNVAHEGAMQKAVNAAIVKAPGQWMYYCFNAEYLFHPFSEHRNVVEMLAFHTEERRDSMLTYVIDLYAGDLTDYPNAVCRHDAWLDRSGYYAATRKDQANNWQPLERQLDFFGGLRWRYEEHVPWKKRKIDRIGIFRAVEGLELQWDHTFNIPEYNTYACPWHHNLTSAICSFRTAKALRSNPGSRHDIANFRWHNSTQFQWRSQQLMDLGLMEPGQWF